MTNEEAWNNYCEDFLQTSKLTESELEEIKEVFINGFEDGKKFSSFYKTENYNKYHESKKEYKINGGYLLEYAYTDGFDFEIFY